MFAKKLRGIFLASLFLGVVLANNALAGTVEFENVSYQVQEPAFGEPTKADIGVTATARYVGFLDHIDNFWNIGCNLNEETQRGFESLTDTSNPDHFDGTKGEPIDGPDDRITCIGVTARIPLCATGNSGGISYYGWATAAIQHNGPPEAATGGDLLPIQSTHCTGVFNGRVGGLVKGLWDQQSVQLIMFVRDEDGALQGSSRLTIMANDNVASTHDGFRFSESLPAGFEYDVKVELVSDAAIMQCLPENGSNKGTIENGDISDVVFQCTSSVLPDFRVGGGVSLPDLGSETASFLLVLDPPAGGDSDATGNPKMEALGPFSGSSSAYTSEIKAPKGWTYNIMAGQLPSGISCPSLPAGTIGNGDVVGADIVCVCDEKSTECREEPPVDSYSVSGTLFMDAADSEDLPIEDVVIQLRAEPPAGSPGAPIEDSAGAFSVDAGDQQVVPFSFAEQVPHGWTWDLSISASSLDANCSVGGSGVADGNIPPTTAFCDINDYPEAEVTFSTCLYFRELCHNGMELWYYGCDQDWTTSSETYFDEPTSQFFEFVTYDIRVTCTIYYPHGKSTSDGSGLEGEWYGPALAVSVKTDGDGAFPSAVQGELFEFTGEALDPHGVASIVVFLNGEPYDPVGFTFENGAFSGSVDTSGLALGTHLLEIAVSDDFPGNPVLNNAPRSFEVVEEDPCAGDTTGPNLAFTPTDGEILPAGMTAIEAAASDASGVDRMRIFIDGQSVALLEDEPWRHDWNASAGEYTLLVRAFDGCENSTDVVHTVNICEGSAPPTVQLEKPPSTLVEGRLLTLNATASDDVGVTKVQFVGDGGVILGAATEEPYSIEWAVETGITEIKARALDSCGNFSVDSHPVTTCDADIDTFELIPPAVAAEGETINISANVEDEFGIRWVLFKVRKDGNLIRVGERMRRPPFEVPLTLEAGMTEIVVSAKPGCGDYSQLTAPITVGSTCDGVVDSVALTSPAAGATLSAGESITLAADASDSSGISKVEFYRDGILIDTVTAAPFSLSWNAQAGTSQIEARAFDNCGNSASDFRNITVTAACDGVVDSIDLTSPAGGSTWLEGQVVTLTANASDSNGISKVQFYQGTTLIGTDMTAPYSMPWTAQLGVTELKARAYDSCNNFRADSHTITVEPACDSVVDSVNLTSPINGSTLTEGQSVTLSANASDSTGISKVQFYQGTTLIGTDTTAPYSMPWTAQLGVTELKARAYDSCNNFRADSHTITVEPACDSVVDSVNLTSPINGSTLTEGQSVTLSANASDSTGISKVQFYQGTTLIGTDTTAPYSMPWTAQLGVTELKARAYDSCNNFRADSHTITVEPACDSVVDSVNLTSPAHGSTLTEGQSVTLSANASDSTGISKVQFYQGTTLIGTDTTAPYSMPWTAQLGVTELKARAYDSCNNFRADSHTITVEPACDSVVDSVNLTSPAHGSTLTEGQSVTLSANASDSTGISKVQFYQGTTLIGTDTTAPYSMPWTAQLGVTELKARAYDSCNNFRADSHTITVEPACDSVVDSVNLTSPINGSTLTEGQSVTLSANASDSTGISKVQFYQGTTLIGTDTTAPYSMPWTAQLGVTELKARAYDSCDNFRADSHTITVEPACDSIVSAVDLTSPASGSVLSEGQTITLTATASDPQGISKVQFLHGSTLIGADTTPPYSISWSPEVGVTQVKARAYDTCGNLKTDVHSVTVQAACDSVIDLISLTNPSDGATLTAGSTITLSATASDANGITKVQFLHGSSLIGADTTPPYSMSWTVVPGVTELKARAWDHCDNFRADKKNVSVQ